VVTEAKKAQLCKSCGAAALRIRREIAAQGAIPFARFMALALYDEQGGYYEQPERPLGRKGDYYTSVCVGRWFCELLAFQFACWCDELASGPVQLLEAGAHDGQLAADLLRALGERRPDLVARMEYWILEPSVRRRQQQRASLGGSTGQVRWFSTWDELPAAGVRGVIFANELLDAMPVHVFGWDAAARGWFEWGVTTAGEGFGWTRLAAPPGLDRGVLSAEGARPWPDLPEELLAVLPNGFTVEISPAARAWWTAAARVLSEGILLSLDYGYGADEAVRPERTGGTARAYAAHHVSAAVLDQPGLQDLTAHVDFGALGAAGEAAGLTTVAFVSQAEFLTRVLERLQATATPFPAWTLARRRQFQTLTHPQHLGRAFRVLVQRRARP